MTIQDYTDRCIEFYHETKEWGDLVDGCYYYTDGTRLFLDESDTAQGGLDVSWAFWHRIRVGDNDEQAEKFIREHSGQQMMDVFAETLQAALDNEVDYQILSDIVELIR